MNLRRPIVLIALAFGSALPATGLHADGGIYIGGGVSESTVQDSANNPGGAPYDRSATGGKLFAGYKFDAIPLVKFACEVGYRELGTSRDAQSGVSSDYRMHGVYYGVLAGVGPTVHNSAIGKFMIGRQFLKLFTAYSIG